MPQCTALVCRLRLLASIAACSASGQGFIAIEKQPSRGLVEPFGDHLARQASTVAHGVHGHGAVAHAEDDPRGLIQELPERHTASCALAGFRAPCGHETERLDLFKEALDESCGVLRASEKWFISDATRVPS